MWISAGSFGAGTTDAWHSNYAVGIGSTLVPNGVRLAVRGIQLTDNTINTPQINVSGISTFAGIGATVTGTTLFATQFSNTGVSTFNNVTDSNSSTTGAVQISGGVGIAKNLYVGAGLSVTGVTTFINGPVFIGAATSTGTASQRLQVTGGAYVSGNLGVGVTNPASNTQVAIAGTLGISEVAGSGARTLLTSSTNGFILNHNDNSQIQIQNQGSGILTYNRTSQLWTIPSGIPFLVGSGTSTGTASQALQVTGGAYVSGNVGFGTTVTSAAVHVVPTSSSIAGLFSGTTSDDMVRITQLGTGNAFKVEDSSNPDITPFVIDANGSIGIGTDIIDPTQGSVTRLNIHADSTAGGLRITNPVDGAGVLRGLSIAYSGNSNAYFVTSNDRRIEINTAGTEPLTLQSVAGRNVGIGSTQPTSKLDIVGDIKVSGITTTNSLSIGATQVISSARQLQNIASLDATTTATIESAIANAPNTFTDLQVTGLSTFVNGPVLIGVGTSTGTASQILQVGSATTSYGAYISGNVGIGTAIPTNAVTISNTRILASGIVTAFQYFGTQDYISGISSVGAAITMYGATGIISATRFFGDGSGLQGVNAFNVINQSLSAVPVFPTFANSTGVTSIGISTTNTGFIPSSGSLGIGTTNPLAPVSIANTATFAAGIVTAFQIFGNQSYISGVSSVGSGITMYAATGIISATKFIGDGTGLTGVNAFNVINQNLTASPVYPTFASNLGVSSVGIATTAPNALVYVPASGSIGIGSTQPAYKLDVLGDINTSTALRVGGNNVLDEAVRLAIAFG
jgi:hypothetical protein